MLKHVLQWSIRYRGIVISLSCLFFVYALHRLGNLPYDVFPEFAAPQVGIQTEAPGLSPEQVELLVTQPIENSLNGLAYMEAMRSNSIQGLSVVTLTFKQDTNIYLARQLLTERLAFLNGHLPQGVMNPSMSPLVSSTGDLLSIGLLPSKSLSLMELRRIADFFIKRKLQAVSGVAKASIFGGEVRQIQVQVHPDRLVEYNLSFDDVIRVAQLATGIRGAGFIDLPNQRITLQTQDPSFTPADLGKTSLIQGTGSNITLHLTLSDVANVVEAPAPAISSASIGGKPGVIINVWSQYGANTQETTQRVEAMLEQMTPALKDMGVDVYPDLFRAANFLEIAIHNLKGSLMIGILLVVIVLFLFLAQLRTAAISCLAIPLSLLAAVIVLERFGFSLNTMTLAGLAIAIGEVVDDAVIDVENILRRLKENAQKVNPQPSAQVVYEASLEVRGSVVYATLAVILVFIPILSLSGLAGRFFSPLGLAYIFAVLASLVVALTLTPALSLLLLRPKDFEHQEPPFVSRLKEKYKNILVQTEKNSKKILIILSIMTLGGICLSPFLKTSFLPDLKEGHFLVHMTAIPGTSLDESLRMGQKVSEALLKIPEVRVVGQRVGRAEADDTFGTHASEFEVDLNHSAINQSDEVSNKIRSVLDSFDNSFPGTLFSINTFLKERMEETLSGQIAPVVVNIVGNDLDVLDQKAKEVMSIISSLPGAQDIQLVSSPDTPQLKIILNKPRITHWGLDAVTVLEAVSNAYEGKIVGQVYDHDRPEDVAVILAPESRSKIEKIGEFKIKNPDGTYVPLQELATIEKVSGRYGILHESGHRVQTILCDAEGTDLQHFVESIKKNVHEKVAFPVGTYLDIGGEAEAQSQSYRDLILSSSISLVAILLLLSLAKGLSQNLLLLLSNLPFSLLGGLLTVFITGGELSLGSLVGFITLFGISLRNAIMMISHFDHLVSEEGKTWGLETAIQGASERLVPVLMTALITLFGLLPLVFQSHKAGVEIEGPMALVISGGLITSTLLNLFVLPTLALRYGRFKPPSI